MRLIDADFTVYAAESEFDEEDVSKIRWLISHIPTVHCHQDYQDDFFERDEEIFETDYCPNCGAKIDLKK
jgi:NAD-dependent SIR2 family protein deacetylase